MSSKNHSLFTIKTFAKISVRRYFRDRVALFFTIAFPLIFLFIFGGLSRSASVSFHVALINQSQTAFAHQFVDQLQKNKTFNINKTINSLDEAKQRMSRSEVDAAIVLPSGFGQIKNSIPQGTADVYYNESNYAAGQALISVLQGNFEGINSHLVKVQQPFTVAAKPINQHSLSKFDYTFSGLVGFSILGLGIFGPVNYFPQMKKQGILRRLQITPIRTWEYFVANVLSTAVIGLLSIAVMFAIAFSVFHFKMAGNFLELAVVIILGILCIFGIGLAVGGWAKNENQAAPLANIITFPMMFLSGTFFPRFAMPEWLQHITTYLPLTPVIDTIRMVATEGKHLTDIGPQLGLIALWTIIIYAIAFRVFRWE